jgi:hypothetical protein
MRRLTRFGCATLLLGMALPAAAQSAPAPSAAVHFETQFQYSTTNIDEGDGVRVPSSTFEFRRIRTYFDIRINDWITGAVESDIGMGRLSVRKAYMDLAFSDAFALKLGQDKKPFSLMELTSSSKFPMIEQNMRIRGVAAALGAADTAGFLTAFRGNPLVPEQQSIIDALQYKAYELGATAHGRVGRFGYDVGVYNGTGIDQADDNDAKSFAGRATYTLPLTKPLTIGAGASYRELNFPLPSDSTTRDGTAFDADVEYGGFRLPGFWILAEATTGSNIATEDRFIGATGIVTYFIPTKGRVEGIEPVFRAGWADPNDAVDDDDALMLVPGFNVFFTGRNKLSLNWEVLRPAGSAFRTYHALRAQAQLYM